MVFSSVDEVSCFKKVAEVGKAIVDLVQLAEDEQDLSETNFRCLFGPLACQVK